jgi:hypothetical protein
MHSARTCKFLYPRRTSRSPKQVVLRVVIVEHGLVLFHSMRSRHSCLPSTTGDAHGAARRAACDHSIVPCPLLASTFGTRLIPKNHARTADQRNLWSNAQIDFGYFRIIREVPVIGRQRGRPNRRDASPKIEICKISRPCREE